MESSLEIGGNVYTVEKFSVRKAILAGRLLNEILGEVPDLSDHVAKFTREYRERNTQSIPRSTAEMRWSKEELDRVSDAAWEASNQRLEIPASPGPMELAAQVFPLVFEVAEDKVLKLLALLVTPNKVVGQAADGNRLDETLAERTSVFMDEDAGQMLDLLAIASEVLQDQFEGASGKLRAVGALIGFQRDSASTEETEPEKPTTTSGSNGSTSTDSLPPTDGEGEPSSIESPSQPSPASSG